MEADKTDGAEGEQCRFPQENSIKRECIGGKVGEKMPRPPPSKVRCQPYLHLHVDAQAGLSRQASDDVA